MIALVSRALLPAQAQPRLPMDRALRFLPADTNGFTFDTGLLRGNLRAGGKSKGLSGVVHVPTGTTLDSSLGLFSHYRIFSTNQRYGTAAWDWPSEAALRPDGSVAVRWPAAAERPFELRALYRWAAADTLDLETSVVAKTNLAHFEVFLASYFSEGFTNSLLCAKARDGGTFQFIAADKGGGPWQAFPRDEPAAAIIQDGRWKIGPSPVDWSIRPQLAMGALGVRRAPRLGLEAVLMAPLRDCFALLTPHETDAHRSMYLSLFGLDLKPGQTARARARLAILGNAGTEEELGRLMEYLRTAK